MRRDEVCKHLRTLEEYGYLKRKKRVGNGANLSTLYQIAFDELPVLPSTDSPDYHSTDEMDYPSTDHPYSNDLRERPNRESISSAPNGAEHTEKFTYRFTDFWACWDIPGTKKERRAAEAKYKSLIKSKAATHDELCAGVRRYMAWCRSTQKELGYIKGPAVWLNKGCWTDELAASGGRPQAKTDFGRYGI